MEWRGAGGRPVDDTRHWMLPSPHTGASTTLPFGLAHCTQGVIPLPDIKTHVIDPSNDAALVLATGEARA